MEGAAQAVPVAARTLALTLVVAFNFFQAGNSRAEYRSLFALNPVGNPFLLITAAGSVLLQWGAMSWPVSADILGLTPLTLREWFWCVAIGASVLVLVEIEKFVTRRIGGDNDGRRMPQRPRARVS